MLTINLICFSSQCTSAPKAWRSYPTLSSWTPNSKPQKNPSQKDEKNDFSQQSIHLPSKSLNPPPCPLPPLPHSWAPVTPRSSCPWVCGHVSSVNTSSFSEILFILQTPDYLWQPIKKKSHPLEYDKIIQYIFQMFFVEFYSDIMVFVVCVWVCICIFF